MRSPFSMISANTSMSVVNWRDLPLLRSFFQNPNSMELKGVIHTSTVKSCHFCLAASRASLLTFCSLVSAGPLLSACSRLRRGRRTRLPPRRRGPRPRRDLVFWLQRSWVLLRAVNGSRKKRIELKASTRMPRFGFAAKLCVGKPSWAGRGPSRARGLRVPANRARPTHAPGTGRGNLGLAHSRHQFVAIRAKARPTPHIISAEFAVG